ncbi:hypothetical protein [Phenylobacterium sp.]|uniref:hypothetical protein n=1 Tax=Phenylobacterium sp. TaxID=1871053 RepID=UPI002B8A986C|nr:hypothetical protein [Phenylobacterium sp.]HVI34300.1 hypothetical protein [Phenylobacterium sp.]
MPYLCYVHRSSGGVPHFEVLPELTRDEAIQRAGELLAQRPDGLRAELWEEDLLVFTLPRASAPAAQVCEALAG